MIDKVRDLAATCFGKSSTDDTAESEASWHPSGQSQPSPGRSSEGGDHGRSRRSSADVARSPSGDSLTSSLDQDLDAAWTAMGKRKSKRKPRPCVHVDTSDAVPEPPMRTATHNKDHLSGLAKHMRQVRVVPKPGRLPEPQQVAG